MQIVMTENTNGKKVKAYLSEQEITQRELFFAFKRAGIKLSESAISNRIKGIVEWTEKELNFLKKYSNGKLKFD
jgi:hypothetical protein